MAPHTVHHCEGDDHRMAGFGDLREEEEISLEVACVHHAHEQIGSRDARRAAFDDLDGHALVFGDRGETIEARDVDALDGLAAKLERAGDLLDGDARIVTDLLVRAGQGVE